MRILTLTVILGLPLMALGQTEPQQTQEQTKESQTTTAPKTTTGKRTKPAEQTQPQAKPETGTSVRGQSNVKGRASEVNRNQPGARSNTSTSTGTSQTNVNAGQTNTGQTNVGSTSQTTTVNKEEFRTRHSELFSLGRHPKEFFVQRYGANHVRLIGNTYFVFLDGCWVSVDVDGFVFSQRVICQGDPDFVVVD